jgi:hypothetical protein
MAPDVNIKIAPGAEEIGLAHMLSDLLSQNMEQNPHKEADFEKLSIDIGLIVPDAEVEITMAFDHGVLTIHPGIKGKPQLLITSDSETIMALSNVKIKGGMPYYFDDTGQEILKAMASRRLKIKGMIQHFKSLVLMSRVMSVN